MLRDQNSRYADAVGRPSIGAKVGVDELKNPTSMRNTSRSINGASVDMFSNRTAASRSAKMASSVTSEELIRPKGPRSMGSAAGFKGGKSAYLEMNSSGYMAAARKSYNKTNINSSAMAVFESKNIKQNFANKVSGRFAKNSASRMKTIKSLSRLV